MCFFCLSYLHYCHFLGLRDAHKLAFGVAAVTSRHRRIAMLCIILPHGLTEPRGAQWAVARIASPSCGRRTKVTSRGYVHVGTDRRVCARPGGCCSLGTLVNRCASASFKSRTCQIYGT
jgi:hypothetical protein